MKLEEDKETLYVMIECTRSNTVERLRGSDTKACPKLQGKNH